MRVTIQINYESPAMISWRTSGFKNFTGLSVEDRRQLRRALFTDRINYYVGEERITVRGTELGELIERETEEK